MDKLKRKKKFMMIKVELEKAYDRVSWEFLEEILRLVGIPVSLKNVIMDCVSIASMQILWNGDPTPMFEMQGGSSRVSTLPLSFCIMFRMADTLYC